MTPTIETVLEQARLLPLKERRELFEILSKESMPTKTTNGNGTEKHFQETATDAEWSNALYELANQPRIEVPDISDEALRRENLYTREDKIL